MNFKKKIVQNKQIFSMKNVLRYKKDSTRLKVVNSIT